MGERIVIARRAQLLFDDDRNCRQIVATRVVNGHVAFSADYTAHGGTHTLRQAVTLRTPRLPVDLVRVEQYERLEPWTHYGIAVAAKADFSETIKVDTRDEIGDLARATNAAITQIKDALGNVRHAASLEEMTATIKQNADNAQQASQLAGSPAARRKTAGRWSARRCRR